MIDFQQYSLVLEKEGQIVFSSDKSNLQPLVECVQKYKSKLKNCSLSDKVVGLAAARLIVYSEMISFVFAGICSESAQQYLEKNKIKIKYNLLTERILNRDKSASCPMELKAAEIKDEVEFFQFLTKKFISSC